MIICKNCGFPEDAHKYPNTCKKFIPKIREMKKLTGLLLGAGLLCMPLQADFLTGYKYDWGRVKIESKHNKEADNFWNSVGFYSHENRKKYIPGANVTYTTSRNVPVKMFCWWGKEIKKEEVKFEDDTLMVQSREYDLQKIRNKYFNKFRKNGS